MGLPPRRKVDSGEKVKPPTASDLHKNKLWIITTDEIASYKRYRLLTNNFGDLVINYMTTAKIPITLYAKRKISKKKSHNGTGADIT